MVYVKVAKRTNFTSLRGGGRRNYFTKFKIKREKISKTFENDEISKFLTII